ncbi:hypothetical protein AB9M93_10190 [Peribacillus frigoritolerans]|uniref:hypothetical protein n=1 Tax=Peribacillus frigoritolerans TaxID=450367 RepID=UPI003516BDFF
MPTSFLSSFSIGQYWSKEKGRLTAPGIRQGTGAMISQSQLVLSQGALKTTDRNLDAAHSPGMTNSSP